MSSVVDFLEKIGSEARWRDASEDDIALALAEADIQAPMCAAILTKNAAQLRDLLGQTTKLIGEYIPGPTPEQEPGREDEDEEEQEETNE